MVGLSGSGKSTTAQHLAVQAEAIRLRSDAVRKHIAGVSLHEKAGDEVYTPEMSDKTYTRLIALGAALASLGYRVILDAKFDRQAKRSEAIMAAQKRGISLTFLHCSAPIEVLRERVMARTGDIADATADILAKQFMEPFGEEAVVKTIDTTQSMANIQNQLTDLFG